jgi:hypothetical protein
VSLSVDRPDALLGVIGLGLFVALAGHTLGGPVAVSAGTLVAASALADGLFRRPPC